MRILVTGASGKLGVYLLDALRTRQDAVIAWSGSVTGDCGNFPLIPVDLAQPNQILTAFYEAKPEVVIHAAAESGVADCVASPEHAKQVNVAATELLANLCCESKARLTFVSTDMVFDGKQGNYREEDETAPLSTYGCLKAAAESAVLARQQLVVRISLLFGPALGQRKSFFDQILRAVQQRTEITLFHDEWRTPLSLRTAAAALVEAATSQVDGILHLGGPERLSRYDMGLRLATYLGLPPDCLASIESKKMSTAEPRPRDLSLNSARWRTRFPMFHIPSYEEALHEMGLSPAAV